FRTPTIEELRAFMNLCKPDWPTNFIEYYSSRFHSHYQANGWVVGRVKMKDWHACVRGQWLQLKFKEDKDFLDKCLMEPIHKMRQAEMRRQADGMFADATTKPIEFYIDFYDKLLQSFQAGQVTEKQLQPHYDRLKAIGVMRLPKSQIEAIFVEMGNDRDRGKGLSVKQLFLNLVARGMTVKQFHDKVTQKMQP
ncbi:MAG TPA: hypothetical protein VKQ08_11145, partial [Cyclobacteriaceae bacterium]|nr:hypothetical protein [Cyclobacteriaceae bacterium]